MNGTIITAADTDGLLGWPALVEALRAGHRLPRAELSDQFLTRGGDTLLSRASWIDGLGIAVKTVTVLPGNPDSGHPAIHGAMTVFDDRTGAVRAVLDSDVVTNPKTVADSLLGAHYLARADSRDYLIIGTGTVARTLAEGYHALFPQLESIRFWGRDPDKSGQLAEEARAAGLPASQCTDLGEAIGSVDIISTATSSVSPVLAGALVQPGTHVDLIGAFRKDMRETDNDLIAKAQLYVDSRETTIDHIGELIIPMAEEIIQPSDILGDFYDLVASGRPDRRPGDITVFKNGGGAHLDLMIASAILDALC